MGAPVLISSDLKKRLLKIELRGRNVAQVVVCLPSTEKNLSLIPSSIARTSVTPFLWRIIRSLRSHSATSPIEGPLGLHEILSPEVQSSWQGDTSLFGPQSGLSMWFSFYLKRKAVLADIWMSPFTQRWRGTAWGGMWNQKVASSASMDGLPLGEGSGRPLPSFLLFLGKRQQQALRAVALLGTLGK